MYLLIAHKRSFPVKYTHTHIHTPVLNTLANILMKMSIVRNVKLYMSHTPIKLPTYQTEKLLSDG